MEKRGVGCTRHNPKRKGRLKNNFPTCDIGVAGVERSEPRMDHCWGLNARTSRFDPSHPDAELVFEPSLSEEEALSLANASGYEGEAQRDHCRGMRGGFDSNPVVD